MSKLDIRYFTGDVEERALSKAQPLAVGSHPSNDVTIDEDDVAVIHCRVSWNGATYEVVSANPDGVEVNGTIVQRKELSDGDEFRVGTVDLVARIDEAPDDDDDIVEAEALEADVVDEEDDRPRRSKKRGGRAGRAEALDDEDEEPEEVEDYADAGKAREDDRSLKAKLRAKLREQAVRPGDRDPLRSKFVLGLFGGSLALLLAAVVIWFMTKRDVATTLLEQADAARAASKFGQADELYTEWLNRFPKNEKANEVHFKRGHVRIEKHTGGASNWEQALKAIDEFNKDQRDREGFDDERPKLRAHAEKIAEKAADTAEKQRKRSHLEYAEKAKVVALRFDADKKFEAKFEIAYQKAEAAVRKQEAIDDAVKKINAALAAKPPRPMDAIKHRLDLLQKYGGTFNRKEERLLQQLLDRTMAAERSLIVTQPLNVDAQTADRPTATKSKPLTLATFLKPADDIKSDGTRVVWLLAKNCCYGVDPVIGKPLWRRPVGFNLPFFPMEVDTVVPALLLFDMDHGELVLVNRLNGELIWRQPLVDENNQKEMLYGPPLVHEGQIYAPTLSRNFYQVDLHKGRIKARLKFSQPVIAPPVVVDGGQKAVVTGETTLMYTLSLAPLKCEAVTYVGHQPGSVKAPLLPIGKMLLMCENDRENSCRLRVLDSSGDSKIWLNELTPTEDNLQVRIIGQVEQQPVLRGRTMYVISRTPEGGRVTAMSVADEEPPGQPVAKGTSYLREIAAYQHKDSYKGSVFLTAGPNDQFWMASNRLSKLSLGTNTIALDPKDAAAGAASQPPQMVADNLYVGRHLPYSTGVNFTEINRQDMIGRWRLVIGAEPLGWVADETKAAVVTEEGDIFRVFPDDAKTGGFKLDRNTTLQPINKLTKKLRGTVLSDNRIAVYTGAGDVESRLWIVNVNGLVDRQFQLEAALEADPVLIPAGLVVPMPGRLRLLRLGPGGGRVQDYEPKFEKDQKPRWKHLAALAGDEVVAATDKGLLIRVQLRMTGGAHLAEVIKRQLDSPIDRPFAVKGETIFGADGAGHVQIFDSATLDAGAPFKLKGPATNAVWLSGEKLFVETGGDRIGCYQFGGGQLRKLWAADVQLPDNAGLTSAPVPAGSLLILLSRSGAVVVVDAETGQQKSVKSLGDHLSGEPRMFAGQLTVPSVDGSLHAVPIE